MCRLRHINDPVLSSLKMEGIRLLLFSLRLHQTILKGNDMIYLLIAIGLSPDGTSTIYIYTQTVHRTTQITTEQHK
jgi:hypothetical protein